MARRLIGLDVGTNAVTIAAVTASNPPRLDLFGQVALPRDAMREGEVADEAAVSEAIARLRTEMGLKKASVRVGIASPRVIVRQVEMPKMSRDDLASALRFQAPDLIPIPIDEAAIDFAVLGTDTPEGGEPTMRVLLAAAHESTVSRLVAAVEQGGLTVGAVDLIPLALLRSLARPVVPDDPDGEGGAEGVVSLGGGVTAIAVHDGLVPQFVRVLGTGGRELTEAIAAAVELPLETAESLKRQLGTPGDSLLHRASGAMERPLAALVEDVRSSLDYYSSQTGATPLRRVLLTGGGAQLPGIAERLAQSVGVPVEVARPRELLDIGDVGFAEHDLPRLDPYLAASVGLALGGAGNATVINLLSRNRKRVAGAPANRSRVLVGSAVVGGLLVAALLVPTMARRSELANTKDDITQEESRNTSLQREIGQLGEARAAQERLDTTQAQVQTVLATDVSWAGMLHELSSTIPDGVRLTGFDGTVATVPGAAAASNASSSGSSGNVTTADAATAPLSTALGTVNFTAEGADYESVTEWLNRLAELPSFSRVFVPNAARAAGEHGESVSFTSNAAITDAARSQRLAQFEGTDR